MVLVSGLRARKRERAMARRVAGEKAEVLKLRRKEKQLREALKMLFDLLEEYAPTWYTEEHHENAGVALHL